MQGPKRRIIQALSYELILLCIASPLIAHLFSAPLSTSTGFTVSTSIIALIWNVVFNALFERWEAWRRVTQRSLKERIYHAIGFEGGLMLFTVPLMVWMLHLDLWHAVVADLAMTLAIMVYTFIFQWCFDKLFGEPERG